VDALSAFGGIRIEDDLVVQDQGIRNLTRESPSGRRGTALRIKR